MGLITLSKLKNTLGISDTTQDTELQDIIDSVSDMIESIAGRKLDSTAYTDDKYIGTNTTYLHTRQYPIISIEKIEVDGSEITDFELLEEDKNTGGIYRENTWKRISFENPINNTLNGSPLRTLKNISVSYTAGYASIPLGLQRVTLQECVRVYKGEDVKGNVSSWRLGNASESYTGGLVDENTGMLMKNYNYIVNNYKNIVIVD